MDIIFARTRWNYDSYTDYWKLVELSGFPICYIDEVDLDSNNLYIISPINGEVHELWNRPLEDVKAHLVLWNLERPGQGGSLAKFSADNVGMLKYFHQIYVSDRKLASILHEFSDRFNYMTLGIHDGLGMPGFRSDKYYDFITLSCYSNNRSWLFNSPTELKGIIQRSTLAPNAWGVKRDEFLTESRFMLNIHQDAFPFIEPLRFALAAAYGLPIVSDFCEDAYPYDEIVMKPYFVYNEHSLYEFVHNYNTQEIYNKALDFRDYMLDSYKFRDCVEMAIYRDFT